MSNKWVKRLLGLIAVAAVVGGVIAYFTRKDGCCSDEDEFSDDFEDEDFDLDEDLKETSREYVSLTPEPSESTSSETETEEDSEE